MTHPALPYQLTTISKLPPELLISVFQCGVEVEFHTSISEPPNPFLRPVPFIRRASQVCRFWRDVSRNVPSLWSTFPYYETYGARWITEFLNLSKSSRLDVKLSSGLRSRNAPPSNVNALCEHSHRIRLLHVTTHSSTIAQDLQQLLGRPMPNLETLVLSYGFGTWNLGNTSAATFPLFLREGAPSLTTFISYRCYVDLSSAALSRLRILEFHEIPDPYCPTISQWLDGLRNMPFLEKLSITQSILPEFTDVVVDLPCLRVLRFAGGFAGFGLLSQLVVPCLEQLDVSLTCAGPHNANIPEETIREAFRRSLHHREERLAGHTLAFSLRDDRLALQILSSSILSTEGRFQLLVELKWNSDHTIPYGAITVIDSIRDRIQQVSALATRLDVTPPVPNHSSLHLNPISPHLALSLAQFFSHLSHIRTWMAHSVLDIRVLAPLLDFQSTSPQVDIAFPSLDTISLKNAPSGAEIVWVKEFVDRRDQLQKPIRQLRILPPADGSSCLKCNDLGCPIQYDKQGIFIRKIPLFF